ncbi:MAG: LON peptidase substrate-binding domain-containing protein [Acidobacteria bacterium]|nr:LON peptidase substrate-binding domain-containing protein [Acidobacteriota bacterium]
MRTAVALGPAKAGRYVRACALLAALLFTPCAAAQTVGPTPPAGGVPDVIPIFPLEAATLFPNGTYPLHIFEPRYRAMVADALKGNRIIGMVTLQPGHEAEYEGRPPIFPIGCAGLITEYEELPDGRYNIVLGGLVKFRVLSEDNSRPYRLARIEKIAEPLDDRKTAALAEQRTRLESLLDALADKLAVGQPPPGMPDETLVDLLSQFLPLEAAGDRQRLLEMEDPLARAGAVIQVLEKMVK